MGPTAAGKESSVPAAYLVEDGLGGVGQGDGLLEAIADLLQFLAFGPVIESAGHVDSLGSMGPARGKIETELAMHNYI